MYYRHSALFPNLLITAGTKEFCEENGCYWYVDVIASYQRHPKITKDSMLQQIQFWKVIKSPEISYEARVICERDSNDIALYQDMEYTDLNLDLDTRLWLSPCDEQYLVVMRPDEY